MPTVEELLTLLASLKTDLEGVASAAKAEFEKLEAEVAAGQPANLEPLKQAIESLDAQVKGVVVPTT